VRVAGALRFAVREAALGDVPAGRVERDGARPGAAPDRLRRLVDVADAQVPDLVATAGNRSVMP